MWNELVLKQTGKDVITDSWPQLRSSEWLQKSCNKPKILMLFPLARWRYSKLQCLYYFPWLPRDASVDYSEDCTVNTVKLWTFNWSLMTGILSSLWGVSQRWKLWVVLALTHNCVTVVHVMVVMCLFSCIWAVQRRVVRLSSSWTFSFCRDENSTASPLKHRKQETLCSFSFGTSILLFPTVKMSWNLVQIQLAYNFRNINNYSANNNKVGWDFIWKGITQWECAGGV